MTYIPTIAFWTLSFLGGVIVCYGWWKANLGLNINLGWWLLLIITGACLLIYGVNVLLDRSETFRQGPQDTQFALIYESALTERFTPTAWRTSGVS